MGDIDVDGKGSIPGDKGMIRNRCLVRCAGRIGLWKELRSCSDVRASERLRFRVTVKHE